MDIKIRGASEHNLKDIDLDISDGLTCITGVSGSGKTSLVFDTMYHEARRRFLNVVNSASSRVQMPPAKVRSITGIGPTVAVGQNLLNRNPNSTLATASGLHPFFRLLYARFGIRFCPDCGEGIEVLSDDEIIDVIRTSSRGNRVTITAPIVKGAKGSHKTLIKLLVEQFDSQKILIDGSVHSVQDLTPSRPHDIEIVLGIFENKPKVSELRNAIVTANALGATSITMRQNNQSKSFSMSDVCSNCGSWYGFLEAKHFRVRCIHCEGKGCERCNGTGLHPLAASVKWHNNTFPDMMSLTVDEAKSLFDKTSLPRTAARLKTEIQRRLDALVTVGLGYIQLKRPSPSLSRGESQRVRLAVSLTSRLEDIVHVLDEPTIGQHPVDVSRLLPAFRKLLGPVVYVEHDRVAASHADRIIDLGPGAGEQGGEIVFTGTPKELWKADCTTGQFFSLRKRVPVTESRPPPEEFITIESAKKHNLKDVTPKIPIGRLSVITGVSGSGKSTLVEHVLVPSLQEGEPIGCRKIQGIKLKPIMVDQNPIGKNPRSNPGTYTKLSNIVRDLFASETGLSPSHFSFNRPEGQCPTCKGMGAVEVKMRYLPSIWITCSDCEGKRFKNEVLMATVRFGDCELSIADVYELSLTEIHGLFKDEKRLPARKKRAAARILDAMVTIGLGYLPLGQSSPSLSGGEAQRVKLAKYLGKRKLSEKLLILDEPSTGLHPRDLSGLLSVLDRLSRAGATIVVVEHNTDVIRSADWIIDLGPGAGPEGGELLYCGPLSGFQNIKRSLTAEVLHEKNKVQPRSALAKGETVSKCISIKDATANNLKSISVEIPKSKLTVVTGISGSGKSSLVRDVLQAEAERRYLESLSVYERQGTSEGPEAPVESVRGLGVSVAISSRRRRGAGYWSVYEARSTVGTVTEISNQLNVLMAAIGERICSECGSPMRRNEKWVCPKCNATIPLAGPSAFSPSRYYAACEKCHGVRHLNIPAPEKLIIAPEKPICDGAMYSPGYYPGKYFCEEKSAAAGLLIALGKKYGFDPKKTSWNEISEEGKQAFLHGDDEKLEYSYLGTRKGKRTRVNGKGAWWGFYGIVNEWDVGETFTDKIECDRCSGTGLKEKYLAYNLAGLNIHQLKSQTISELRQTLTGIKVPEQDRFFTLENYEKVLKRLKFLETIGLGYLYINQGATSLSAGEAQRIILSSLLGSDLTSLTILLDEPTRGMHPSEVSGLVRALDRLTNEGNTVVVVEHDPVVIQAADQIIDIGPAAGIGGGNIVAKGTPVEMKAEDTITARWLCGDKKAKVGMLSREPIAWMKIEGARGNNLKDITIEVPLGVLVGVCGVSGSGKSTLFIDTLGRAVAPKKFTTSVAYEQTRPEEYDKISGTPNRAVILDQGRKGIRSPGSALGVLRTLLSIYSKSEDAKALGLDRDALKKPCTACNGRGQIKTELGFLPNVYSKCEICKGSGRAPEVWQIKVKGYTLPDLYKLTLNEIYNLFKENAKIEHKLRYALDVGLGYLVLRQPSMTLSGGEIQRLKIAKELSRNRKKSTLFILDEPTVGQHLEDVQTLIDVLHRLVEEGNSVLVIEHHPHLLAACDWLIELGPGGGPEGGKVIAEGSPETISTMRTATASYIKEVLEGGL